MNKLLLLLIFINVNYVYSQSYNKFFKKEIILIGEYHYYKDLSTLKLKLLNKILSEEKYNNTDIVIEKSPDLEYWLNIRDTNKLKKYFSYNSDKYFTYNTLSKVNKQRYYFYKKILNKKKIHEFYCIDSYYTIRPVLYTLNEIIRKYKKTNISNKYHYLLDSILCKPQITLNDTIFVHKIKTFFQKNIKEIKLVFTSYDFFYLKKILDTPRIQAFSKERDIFLTNSFEKIYSKNRQIVAFIGAGHIKKKNKNNFGNMLRKKHNTILHKRVSIIGIIPKDVNDDFVIKNYDYYVKGNCENIFE